VNGNVKLGRAAARTGEWAQHFSNASCFSSTAISCRMSLQLAVFVPRDDGSEGLHENPSTGVCVGLMHTMHSLRHQRLASSR